jgi:hypothetical protein
MTWLGRARSFNLTIAVVAVLAWITGTNHCFLGHPSEPQNGTAPVCQCPGHSGAPGSAHHDPSAMLGCCQGLLSSNVELAEAKAFPLLVAIQLLAIGHLTLPKAPQGISVHREYDTGPPSAGFFVEIVLRHSLPENAPPFPWGSLGSSA